MLMIVVIVMLIMGPPLDLDAGGAPDVAEAGRRAEDLLFGAASRGRESWVVGFGFRVLGP